MHKECFPKGICIHDIFPEHETFCMNHHMNFSSLCLALVVLQEFQYQWNLSHTKLNKTSVTKTQYQKFWYM